MSLKKLPLASALAILVSMTLFMPYVRAELELSSEFVEPIKNASFEVRDENIPGDGVYRCPPWVTNNGGWRELRGDVDGDGDVDWVDFGDLAWAFGSYYGDPKYDLRCDFDGDGDVDWVDYGDLAWDYGKTATRLDGTHSWYTDGEGIYQMWQVLDSYTQNLVRGKTVTFAFYFRPESVAPDGEENMARAGIKYQRRINSQLVWGQYWSEWVKPTNDTMWYCAFVTGKIHHTASYIRVMIEGKRNNEATGEFKAWIDQTSLCISTFDSESYENELYGTEGLVTVSANIFQLYEKDPPPPQGFPDCIAYLSVGVGVERNWAGIGAIVIRGIEIDVKLLTDGHLNIYYCEQRNDRDIDVEPEEQEEAQNQALLGAGVAIGAGIGVATFLLPIPPPYVFVKPMISITGSTFGKLYLQCFASDPHIESADEVEEYVRERWMYSYLEHFACGSYGLTLEFDKGNIAEVEVTARAYWQLGTPPFCEPWGSTEVSTTVTVSL